MQAQLSRIDFFPKTVEELRMRTISGGLFSLIAIFLFVLLVIFETSLFLSTHLEKELYVDEGLNQKLTINIDILFPSLPCSYMSLDAVDSSGESFHDIESSIFQQRITGNGKPLSKAEEAQLEAEIMKNIDKVPIPQNANGCGSCYGAETDLYPCCETCDDVREAYRDKGWAFGSAKDVAQCKNEGFTPKMIAQKNEGCRLYGSIEVNKVAGNFHIAPGRSLKNAHGHSHDMAALSFSDSFNTTHIINSLSFGDEYEGRVDPLDGTASFAKDRISLYQYFIKIVPTSIIKQNGVVLETNQYSTTKHYQAVGSAHDQEKLPGVFFIYDLSPIQVVYRETSQSWADYLTTIFGTAGGLFTISMLADWFFSSGATSIKRTISRRTD